MNAMNAMKLTTVRRRQDDGPRRRTGRWGLRVGLAILALYALAALIGPLVAPHNPAAQNLDQLLAAPSLAHPFGTDDLGRDALSRWLAAARIDLLLAMVATLIAFLIGVVIGVLSGYAGGWVDSLFNRVTDIFQTLPAIVLLIVLLLVVGSGMRGIVFALVATGWVSYARLTRAQVMSIRSQDYVLAARLAGFSHPRTMLRHILPNVWLQSFVYMTSDVIGAIVAIASLGYLGIGIQPPTPEWGQMIGSGQVYLRTAPWLTVIPGAMIVILGLGLALTSDALTARIRRMR